jgi:protein TonB
MTAATPGHSDESLFSLFSTEGYGLHRTKHEAFALSLLAQALILSLIIFGIRYFPPGLPPTIGQIQREIKNSLPVVFSGGGGGGDFDKLPASQGVLPRASLDNQLTPPTVILPKEMPKLPVEATVAVAPEMPLPQGSQYGDPMSKFSAWLSSGPGGPGGVGTGCCNGVGPSNGPGAGPGPGGPGLAGATVPRAIYSPEPSFSDEARKAKEQGIVVLLLVVGVDGRTYNVRVQSSLGMGLDEKAIEAVSQWRFQPATLNGQPIARQIAVEVNFHLY